MENPTSEEKVLAALAHGSVLFAWFGPIAPTILWVTQRNKSKYVRFHASSPLKRKPSDYIRENFWFVMDPSERAIDAQCELVGEDRFLWGSDYPHIDSHLRAIDEVRDALAPMTPARRAKVLGLNAKRLFSL